MMGIGHCFRNVRGVGDTDIAELCPVSGADDWQRVIGRCGRFEGVVDEIVDGDSGHGLLVEEDGEAGRRIKICLAS